MRPDTKEIADALDEAADLCTRRELEAAQHLLAKIAKLLTQWIERYLSP